MPPETPEIGLYAFFRGRRCNRDDLVLARIDRRHQAADGAALARRIRTLEHQHQRALVDEARIAHQFGNARLGLGQFALVRPLGQLLVEIELGQHVLVVDGVHDRRRHRHLLPALLLQAAAHRIEHDAADGQRAVFVIGALDDDPRRMRGIGHAQHMAGDLLQLVVGLDPLVAILGHPPGGMRIGFQRLQPLLLAIPGEMEPELEDERALVDQHRLETVDFVETLVHLVAFHLVGDAVGDRLRVPRTGEDADLALWRQRTPVAPHVGARALLVARLGKRQRRDVARIHPRIQQVDGFALAAAVDPADQYDDREFLLLQHVVLDVEQRRAQLGNFGLEGFLVDDVAEFCRFKHVRSSL